jgi:hypothetical protein
MSCMLRAEGSKKAVLQLREMWKAQNVSYYIKGERRFPKNPTSKLNNYSGIGALVSEADFDRVDLQVKDAVKYLKKNEGILKKLGDLRFKEMKIDFGIEKRNVWAQFEFFPPTLLKLAGNLNIGLEISLYQADEPEKKSKPKKQSRKQK